MPLAWIFLLWIYSCPAFSQTYPFRTYTSENGLPHSQVLTLFQDSRGYIWTGTMGGGAAIFDGITFKTLTTRDGLGSNMINAFCEDHKGNIWIATDGGGISRYDGKNIVTYTTANGLSNDVVRCIYEDTQGILWFGTSGGGLNRYDGRTFTPYTTKNGLPGDRVRFILEDKNKVLWLGIVKKGLCRYDGKEFKLFTTRDGLSSDYVFCGTWDLAGNMWIGTFGGGLCKYDGRRFTAITSAQGLPNDSIWDLAEDSRGRIWMATNGAGMVSFDPGQVGSDFSGQHISFNRYGPHEGFTVPFVFSVLADHENNIWAGTDGGGLWKFPGEAFALFSSRDGMSGNMVNAISGDQKGNLWFGTETGITGYDGKSFARMGRGDGLIADEIWALLPDSRGNLWVGAMEQGITRFLTFPDGKANKKSPVYFSNKNGLGGEDIFSLFEDRDKNIWIGTYSGGVTEYDGKKFRVYTAKDGLSSNIVWRVYQSRDGNMWFATDKGLSRYDGKTFRNFSKKDGLPYDFVYALAEDNKGNIWVGTFGGGVCLCKNPHAASPSFVTFSSQDGLTDDGVYSLVFDEAGDLWIGTSKGLDRLDVNEYYKTGSKKFHHYGKEEGFLGIECNQNAAWRDKEENLWFGTIHGAVKYNPREDKRNAVEPSILITSVRLFLRPVDWSRYADSLLSFTFLPYHLVLPYNKNHLTFDYTGISFTIPEKVQYQYRLEGFDGNWSPPTHERYATYSNIPPGSYIFRVKSCNNDGVWNKIPAEFRFTILSPFWRTCWFYGFCGLFFFGSTYGTIQWRLKNLRRAKKLLEEKVKIRTLQLEEKNMEIEEKNKDITDSIRYARRIQQAILPKEEQILHALPLSFTLYLPRDIVSGDFYWFAQKEGYVLAAAVDCTGHGVPGAFMSMIGSSLLNEMVNEKNITDPADILHSLHAGVVHALKQGEEDSDSKDGMDVALCRLNTENGDLFFAGAMRPLYLVQQDTLTEIKGDKFPIGGSRKEDGTKYTTHTVSLKPGERFYLSTDGYADQFGGPEKKKLMTKRFKELLLQIRNLPLKEQEKKLENFFTEWKGNEPQLDDVLVIGAGWKT